MRAETAGLGTKANDLWYEPLETFEMNVYVPCFAAEDVSK